jgi:Mg-chelatase subunit ChlD
LTPLAEGAALPDQVLEGDEARERLDEEQRGSTSRRDLERAPHFDEVSPEVGVLDEQAFDSALAEDADGALTLLAALTGATDEKLREAARRLAARVVLEVTRAGPVRSSGVGRLERRPADRADGDLDLDASLEPLQLARAGGTVPALEELRVVTWGRPSTAVCLVVDRSGSMNGVRLATAALAAASAAWRAGADYSVVAFSGDAVVVKSQDATRRAEDVADDVLRLRGHGTTDLALALRTARAQLDRSRAHRKVTILLSDCRPTTGGDPVMAARQLDEVGIIAPDDDSEDAFELSRLTGSRCVTVAGPATIPAAFARLLDE